MNRRHAGDYATAIRAVGYRVSSVPVRIECNLAIGKLRESPELARRAAAYLEATA